MKIADLMTTTPVILEEEASVLEAAKMMKQEDCGILPIGDKKNIVGVVTDRDIVIRVIAEKKDLNETTLAEIMTEDAIFCKEDDSLEEAISKMDDNNTRRILVKNENQELCGILSLGDVIRGIQDKSLLAKLFSEIDTV